MKASGVKLASIRRGVQLAARRSPVPDLAASQLLDPGPALSDEKLPAADLAAFRRLDAEHQSILRHSTLADWRLDAVLRGYQDLLNRTTDPVVRAVLQGRIDQTGRQVAAAAAARRFSEVAQSLRQLDQRLATATPAPRPAEPESNPYDATGLLMRSSKLVDGQQVYALIGPDGVTSAYLRMAPGLSAGRYLSCRVGVRGPAHFDSTLHMQVFSVQEIEPLSEAP